MKHVAAALALVFLASLALGQGGTTPPSQQGPESTLPGTVFPVPLMQGQGSRSTSPLQISPTLPVPLDQGSPPGAKPFDYGINLQSDVFGAQLFTGSFTRSGAALFNPDHVISTGDQVQIRLWGAFDFDSTQTVDAQGNVFLPHVGPVRLSGVPNRNLQKVLESSLRKAFRANVYSYISLAGAQPVRIFVTGFVNRPGMYDGTSGDSVLRYLDLAGGIDAERGSFLDVQVKRGSTVRATVNLYDFLLFGALPALQLANGDAIVVQPRKSTYRAGGLVENAKRFEFVDDSVGLVQLIMLAKPRAQATHVRVIRNSGTVRNTEYYPLNTAATVKLLTGDEVEFTADKRPGTITVRVEGEHLSAQEYVLPYGSRIEELVKQIQFTERSDSANLQLFRISVKERQRVMLQTALKSMETSVLTARSGTSDEASLRKGEAELILQWVERARKIEPTGQVLVAQAANRRQLLLENGDLIKVPIKDGLVLVSGEVLFPNAVAWDERYRLEDYVRRAGGYSQQADTSRIVVAHRDGSYSDPDNPAPILAGDEILVLPKIEVKSRQITKDLSQIIFNLAVAAKVIFGGL